MMDMGDALIDAIADDWMKYAAHEVISILDEEEAQARALAEAAENAKSNLSTQENSIDSIELF